MKKDIHPNYHHNVTVQCACGNEFTTGSVIEGPIRVEICASCHPFFTGEKKYVDTEGRVDRFQRKRVEAEESRKKATQKDAEQENKKKQQETQPTSLREMMEKARQ